LRDRVFIRVDDGVHEAGLLAVQAPAAEIFGAHLFGDRDGGDHLARHGEHRTFAHDDEVGVDARERAATI
jgi:hypothetical protein